MEKYMVINGFDNYAVSNYGNLKNIKTNRVLKLFKNKDGYITYVIKQNGIRTNFKIHRLVAIYFIDNINNKPYVNHLDGDKANNHYSNLEWCTAKENDTHARENGLKNQNKPIIAKNLVTGEEFVFYSIRECGRILGINVGSIHRVLKKCRNKCHNYTFKYINL